MSYDLKEIKQAFGDAYEKARDYVTEFAQDVMNGIKISLGYEDQLQPEYATINENEGFSPLEDSLDSLGDNIFLVRSHKRGPRGRPKDKKKKSNRWKRVIGRNKSRDHRKMR